MHVQVERAAWAPLHESDGTGAASALSGCVSNVAIHLAEQDAIDYECALSRSPCVS
jgi:hypothetical protein